jgi:hypothetical protein
MLLFNQLSNSNPIRQIAKPLPSLARENEVDAIKCSFDGGKTAMSSHGGGRSQEEDSTTRKSRLSCLRFGDPFAVATTMQFILRKHWRLSQSQIWDNQIPSDLQNGRVYVFGRTGDETPQAPVVLELEGNFHLHVAADRGATDV